MAQPPFPSRSSGPRCISAPAVPMRPSYTSCREHWQGLEGRSNRDQASRFLTLTSIPTMLYIPQPTTESLRPIQGSPFLRLPTEIRLQIYSLLVLPREASELIPFHDKVSSSSQDYWDYEKKRFGTDRPVTADLSNPTLLIRTIDGVRYSQQYGPKGPRGTHVRSMYKIRADRFRSRCMDTTYHCVNIPRIEDQLGILGTNKQIHAEAAELMYSSYTFDFDSHVEAMIPFFNDLTPFARSCVKSIRFVKRAWAYDKEFDRAEWNSAMRYLTSASSNIHLQKLDFGVVAGRPGPHGWDRIATYTPQDFKLLKDSEGLQWMQYLFEIKGLKTLDINAIVEHCPPASTSTALANFVRFSASIDTGFSIFLRQRLMGI